jgi:hypothetical protein
MHYILYSGECACLCLKRSSAKGSGPNDVRVRMHEELPYLRSEGIRSLAHVLSSGCSPYATALLHPVFHLQLLAQESTAIAIPPAAARSTCISQICISICTRREDIATI